MGRSPRPASCLSRRHGGLHRGLGALRGRAGRRRARRRQGPAGIRGRGAHPRVAGADPASPASLPEVQGSAGHRALGSSGGAGRRVGSDHWWPLRRSVGVALGVRHQRSDRHRRRDLRTKAVGRVARAGRFAVARPRRDGRRHRRARSPRACDRAVRRVGVVEYPDRGSAPRRCRAARRVRRTVRHRPELGAPARPLLRARLPLGEPRSASLRHGLHDHVFRQRPVSPRGLGLLAGLDRAGDGAGATRRLPARPSEDRAASDPDSGRRHLRGRGAVPALASGFRSGLPRRLAALHARVGRRRLDGVAAAHVGRRRRPARRSLRHGLRRERRAPQPRTDARRRHLRGPGRTNDGR